MELFPNPHKNLIIGADGKKYARYPIRTHVITPEDKDLAPLVEKYVKEHLKPGDVVFMGEKAILKGRLNLLLDNKNKIWDT